jgi:hypothetical protein
MMCSCEKVVRWVVVGSEMKRVEQRCGFCVAPWHNRAGGGVGSNNLLAFSIGSSVCSRPNRLKVHDIDHCNRTDAISSVPSPIFVLSIWSTQIAPRSRPRRGTSAVPNPRYVFRPQSRRLLPSWPWSRALWLVGASNFRKFCAPPETAAVSLFCYRQPKAVYH